MGCYENITALKWTVSRKAQKLIYTNAAKAVNMAKRRRPARRREE